MLADGIIVLVDEPTGWVNSLVAKEKQNGSLQVHLYPRGVNKAIKREHYHVPTGVRVTTKLHGSSM